MPDTAESAPGESAAGLIVKKKTATPAQIASAWLVLDVMRDGRNLQFEMLNFQFSMFAAP